MSLDLSGLYHVSVVAHDLGGDLSTSLTDRLAHLPTWVLYFVIFAIIWLMKPWENVKGIPTWAWILIAGLAVWVLIKGR